MARSPSRGPVNCKPTGRPSASRPQGTLIEGTPARSAGFGNPVPEELIIVGAGIQTARNEDFGPLRWLMLPSVIAGAVAADVLLYSVGRLFGPRLLQYRWLARLAPPQKRDCTLKASR